MSHHLSFAATLCLTLSAHALPNGGAEWSSSPGQDPCDGNECSEHGSCAPVGDGYICECDEGYEGSYCAQVAETADGSYPVSHNGIDYHVNSNEYLGTVHACYEECFDIAQDAASGSQWASFMASLGLLPDFLECAFGFTDELTFGECMAEVFLDAFEMGIVHSEAPGFEELYDCLDACDAENSDLGGCTGGGCEGADDPEEGDDCNTDYDCGDTMYCHQIWMTCKPTLAEGKLCGRDDVCDSGCCEGIVPRCEASSACQ